MGSETHSLISLNQEDMHIFQTRTCPLRILISEGLVNGSSDTLIFNVNQRLIEQLVADFQANAGGSNHILIPAPGIREIAATVIGLEHIELLIVGYAVGRV